MCLGGSAERFDGHGWIENMLDNNRVLRLGTCHLCVLVEKDLTHVHGVWEVSG